MILCYCVICVFCYIFVTHFVTFYPVPYSYRQTNIANAASTSTTLNAEHLEKSVCAAVNEQICDISVHKYSQIHARFAANIV
jgi:hypothetical protein